MRTQEVLRGELKKIYEWKTLCLLRSRILSMHTTNPKIEIETKFTQNQIEAYAYIVRKKESQHNKALALTRVVVGEFWIKKKKVLLSPWWIVMYS